MILAFDPEDIVPLNYSFGQRQQKSDEDGVGPPSKKAKTQGVAEPAESPEEEVDQADPKPDDQPALPAALPTRLRLWEFSHRIGWRPTGLNSMQSMMFRDRFPQEFSVAAMATIVMPMKDKVPYVCPTNDLPCPFLATANALKSIECNPDLLDNGDPRAVGEISYILNHGVVVQWVHFDTYLEFMFYVENAHVQQDTVVVAMQPPPPQHCPQLCIHAVQRCCSPGVVIVSGLPSEVVEIWVKSPQTGNMIPVLFGARLVRM